MHPDELLVEARKLTTSREMLLWMTPSEAPKALQASECSELLDPMRASCWISAQHQPGKFKQCVLRFPIVYNSLYQPLFQKNTKIFVFSIQFNVAFSCAFCWAEAPIQIASMTLTIKLVGNWSSFQLANSAPPLCGTHSAIAPSARIVRARHYEGSANLNIMTVVSQIATRHKVE